MKNKPQKKQSTAQAIAGFVGGSLFLFFSSLLAIFVIVGVVMLFQGEAPSIGLYIGLVGGMLVSWWIATLSGESLRRVIGTIVTNIM